MASDDTSPQQQQPYAPRMSPYSPTVHTQASPPPRGWTPTSRRLNEPLHFFSRCGVLVQEMDAVTRQCVATYRCGEMLGQGGFAKVFDFVNVTTGERFACKIIEKEKLKDPSKRQKFFAEIDIHRRLKHPNILEFIRFFEDTHHYYLLLERCCRQSLMDIHQERIVLSVEEIQHIMVQLLMATMYMHSNRIIHRDLKLGNIMIDPYGNVKVGDFGFAAELAHDDERKNTMCGTPNYIAPEVLRSTEKGSPGYSYSVDTWSLGVILFTLAVGKPPFETAKVQDTYELIKVCRYRFPEGTLTNPSFAIPPAIRQMVGEMLRLRPEERSSLIRLRQHPFLDSPPKSAPPSLVDLDAEISPVSQSPVDPAALRGGGSASPVIPNRPSLVEQIDAMQLIGSETSSTDVRLPPMVADYAHFPKYGWCYHVVQEGGRRQMGVSLNDRTKIVYDEGSDEVWYFNREKREQRHLDEPYYFPTVAAAMAMAETPRGSAMSLGKKISIIRFIKSFMQRYATASATNAVDAQAAITVTAVQSCVAMSATGPRCTAPVFVKDVVRLDGATEIPKGVHCTAVALRLSSGAHQYAFDVASCGVDEGASVAETGPHLPSWTADFYRPQGTADTFQVVFASKPSNLTIVTECDITVMRCVAETGRHFVTGPTPTGTLRLPAWVARSILRSLSTQ